VDCNHQHFCGAAAGASDIPPRPPTHMPVSLPSNTIRRLRSSFLCIGELCCAGHAGTRRLKRGLCRGSNVIIYWFMESACGALVMITRRGVGCNCGGGGAAASKQQTNKMLQFCIRYIGVPLGPYSITFPETCHILIKKEVVCGSDSSD
jgi:hypothetical protein